jgi:Lysyl oxidase
MSTLTTGTRGFIAALATGIGLLVLSTGTATATEPLSRELESVRKAVLWSGSVARADVPAGQVPECASTACDRFDLRVDLPRGAFHRKAGGVEVSIRWSSFGDNLRLYVYRGGTRVAASDGIIATAQSVLIPKAPNGKYAVYAAFDPDSVSDRIQYEAVAEVERPPKAKPLRPLLPDLALRPQRNVSFETPFIDFFEPAPPPGESCYGSEKAEEGAQTCLRFDQIYANVGEGPLEMRFAIPRDPASQARTISQRIYRSDGASFEERAAGEWEFHEVHGHFHYTGFGVSRLWATDATGARVGAGPVRTGDKVSFCIADIEIDAWAEKGNGPRTYGTPECLFPTESDAENDYLVQGQTPGWADVYDWFLPDQYIEVSGVADGIYLLETIADPDNTILEANESNNCGSVYVRLSNVSSSPTAELLGPGPPCERPRRPGTRVGSPVDTAHVQLVP